MQPNRGPAQGKRSFTVGGITRAGEPTLEKNLRKKKKIRYVQNDNYRRMVDTVKGEGVGRQRQRLKGGSGSAAPGRGKRTKESVGSEEGKTTYEAQNRPASGGGPAQNSSSPPAK